VGVEGMSTANYARLLKRLRQSRPRVIAFDTVFEDDAKNTPGGPALQDAMRAAGPRLVLACKNFYITKKETRGGQIEQVEYPELLLEFKELKAAGVGDGYRGLPKDVDDHNRRVDYRVELFRPASADPEPDPNKVKHVPTFAFAVANRASGRALEKHFADLPTASRRVQGEQSKSTTWIDYVGQPGFDSVSAIDVLDWHVPPAKLAGKVVVIGVTASRNPEVYRTPLDGGRKISNPEVQANAIETMLRRSPLRDGSRLIDVLAILVLACVPALASLSASRAVRVAAILGSAAVFLAVAQLAFNHGRILAVGLPLAALAASAAGMIALRVVRRRRIRSRTLSN
jgi:CHASE2 domain-containing sensor protein